MLAYIWGFVNSDKEIKHKLLTFRLHHFVYKYGIWIQLCGLPASWIPQSQELRAVFITPPLDKHQLSDLSL